MLKLYIKDNASISVIEQLQKIKSRVLNAKPVWSIVAQMLVQDTKKCFDKQMDPDGIPWKPLADATLMARAKKRSKGRSKGSKVDVSDARILQDTGLLRKSCKQVLATNTSARIGSNLIYARVHQYGYAKKNIPRRSYLGITSETRERILSRLVAFYTKGG